MNFSKFFIKKPVFCIVGCLLLLLIGYLSLIELPLRQYPDIEKSQITIDTRYSGSASSTVETKITEIIENQISGIEGIRSINSVSRDGRSKITIEFSQSKDINEAANDVRDSISRISGRLPKDSDPPEIYKIDSDADAIMWLNLTSTTLNQMELTEYAERFLIDRLSVVPGVARIRISGQKKKSLRIWLNPKLLSLYNLTVLDIEKKILEENVEFPAGRLESETRDFTVRFLTTLNKVEDFKNLIVKKDESNSYVRLQDIAKVEFGAEEPRQLFRGNGEEMVGLGIVKQTSGNLIKVAQGVKKEFKKIQTTLPENIKIYQSYDTSIFVSEALNDVIFTLCLAIFLVTLVIFIFLRNLRSALIPFLTVPISLIGSFILLGLFGFSINLITLLALVLCTGLVVDDSIVMLENIYQKIEEGESNFNAAVSGAKEVFFAIVSTSIILISVFIPIAFLQGDTAKLFDELAVTIIGAIFFSTIISLTLTPMLCSQILSVKKKFVSKNLFQEIYEKNIMNIISKKKLIFVSILFLVITSIFLFKNISRELAPKEDRGAFFMVLNGPEGSSYKNTVQQMLNLEEKLLEFNKNNEANRILLRVPRSFSGAENFSDGIGIIVLNHWNERRSIWEIISEIRSKTLNISDARIQIFPPRGLGQRRSGSQLQLVLGGDSYEEIDIVMSELVQKIKKNDSFVFVDTDYKKNRPQLKVFIDRKKSSELEVSTSQVGRTLEVLLGGRKVNTFIDKGEEYYIMMQSISSERKLPNDLRQIMVRSSNGELIRLDSLIYTEENSAAKELNRYNRIRAITLKASLKKDYSLGEAIQFIEKSLQEKNTENIKVDYKGQSKEYKDSSKQMFYLFIISLLVVYLVLSAQFESFVTPLIIMVSVPLSISGGIFGLWLFESSLNIFSQIGIIILIGISAKNGILIVEFANQLREKGENISSSIYYSCKKRFRPIIMTGFSTIVGAIPLVVGSGAGSESRQTIGIVIIFGILFSIFLTLIVTPFFYKLIAPYSKQKFFEQ
ncbi:MAG: multidrug transporter AcrB [Rickettsiales bacterium]|nr:multidrug transporter AcrB [Rickettsiales bacterium]